MTDGIFDWTGRRWDWCVLRTFALWLKTGE